MGTNFYLKKNNETKKLVEEKYKFMLLENLNRLLPRERHQYLVDLFGLATKMAKAEYLREFSYLQTSYENTNRTCDLLEKLGEEAQTIREENGRRYSFANDVLGKRVFDSFEMHEKYAKQLTHFCRKNEIVFTDLDLISDLINEKINDFTEKEGYHIGKRSAAGYYCKKCNVTLCDGGFAGIHSSDTSFYDECPICHSDKDVAYVCSFNWQWSKNFWMSIFVELDGVVILDEYENEFTIQEFLKVELQSVPFNMQAEEKEHIFS